MQRIQVRHNEIGQVNRGVTLIEVLMSLMIMAIGVTSVMTLFPIATLRSAQATRLTNAALLKYNVEALLNARPELIFDPDGDGILVEHYRGNDRNYIVDPLGYFSAFEYNGGGASGRAIAERVGNDGTAVATNALRRYEGGVLFRSGFNPDTFGNTPPSDDVVRALRITAAKDSQLGDTWDTQFDFFLEDPALDVIKDANNEIVGIRMPLDVLPAHPTNPLPERDPDALALIQTSSTEIPSTVSMADPEVHRITLYSADGQLSQSYPLLNVSTTGEATWSESVLAVDANLDGHIENRPIPREFQGVVGRVLIQSKRSSDFTWMLSVRRSPDGQARNVDVVVRFGDRLKLEDEYLYSFAPSGAITAGSNIAVFNLDSREPALKRGGYLLDVTNLVWHRIREFEVDEVNDTFSVIFERPASKAATAGALFLPGIIDVYPMGSRSLP